MRRTAAMVLVFVLASCGGGDATSTTEPDAATTQTVAGALLTAAEG